MSFKAFDSSGNEVFLIEINSLCPVEYLTEARQIAYDYFIELEKSQVTLDQMFTKFVKPIGSSEATHCWCPRVGYTHQLDMQLGRMAELNLPWVKGEICSLTDPDRLSKFCVLTDSAADILTNLGLEEI